MDAVMDKDKPENIIRNFIRENRTMNATLRKFARIIRKCKKDSVAREFPEVFENLKKIDSHFDYQRRLLFPLLAGSEMDSVIEKLSEDHKKADDCLKEVLSAYERGHTEDLCVLSGELTEIIREVIRLEEKTLYPGAKELLSI